MFAHYLFVNDTDHLGFQPQHNINERNEDKRKQTLSTHTKLLYKLQLHAASYHR